MRLPVLLLALGVSPAAWAEPPCVCDHPWSFPSQPTAPPPPVGSLFDAAPPPLPRVPRNAQVFVTWPNAEPAWFELVREDGTPVPITVEAASDDPAQHWVRPGALLDAGAIYTVREGDWSITFVVDDVEDAAPPDHTRVQGQGARLEGRCPEHVAAEVRALIEREVDGADQLLTLDEAEPYGVLYELVVRRLGHPEPMQKRFYVRGDQPILGEVISTDYRFQECFENYAGAETTWTYEATVRVFDQAGNMAEAPDAEDRRTTFRFAYNVSEGCACRVGVRPRGGAFLGGALLLLLPLLVSAPRSRRT